MWLVLLIGKICPRLFLTSEQSGLNNTEERIRSVCLRLVGHLGSAISGPIDAALCTLQGAVGPVAYNIVGKAMQWEISRAISADIRPSPTPATLLGLLQAIGFSRWWRSLFPSQISLESLVSLFSICFRDHSHTLQTCAVELLVLVAPVLGPACTQIVRNCVFSSEYLSLHPSIVPLLVESLLASTEAKHVLLENQQDFSRKLWDFAASADPISSHRARECLSHLLLSGNGSLLVHDSVSGAQPNILSLVSFLKLTNVRRSLGSRDTSTRVPCRFQFSKGPPISCQAFGPRCWSRNSSPS